MGRTVLLAWLGSFALMAVVFYILLSSDVPAGTKIVLTVLPVVFWCLGGLAIYREYRNSEKETRRERKVLEEARRILDRSGKSAPERSHGMKGPFGKPKSQDPRKESRD